MKLWSRVCFLVLAVSPICLGEDGTSHVQTSGTVSPVPSIASTHVLNGTENETQNHTDPESTTAEETNSMPGGTVATNLTSTNVPTKETTSIVTQGGADRGGQMTQTTPSTSSGTTAPPSAGSSAALTQDVPGYHYSATVPPNASFDTTFHTEQWPVPKLCLSLSLGYVVLALIIIVIIILCIILYLLRRASRTYSFDLQRPNPVGHLNQPTGTFEPVYLDDLERPVPKDIEATDDLSPPPVANGTSLQSEEKDSSGENAPEEQPEANGVETSPAENTTPSLSSDEADKISNPPSSTSLFFDAIGEQQNENNNNPICSSDPFVEINLDEPAWCDQLLNSSEGSSSVFPFSPFSLSSSSS
ncbi:cell wall protein DAN4 [Neolamprologus brichardi]|uniref:cell wall protein DAN4 n=1 Tax=Neolamprologus brichardi TaxID=32507 RepID=UPI001643BFC1|nr:cell wall protein DAN4 [Neolamprologus brichardi]